MTHCPVCKTEFEDRVYVCTECGNHTIFEQDGEEFTLVFNTSLAKDVSEVDEILDFLHYSDMPEAYAEYDEVMETYLIFVHPEHRRDASKLYSGFRRAKAEEEKEKKKEKAREAEEAKEETSETAEAEEGEDLSEEESSAEAEAGEEEAPEEEASEEEEEEEMVGVYQDKREKYADFHSSGITLIIAAVALAVFTILCALGVVTFFSGTLPIIVFSLLAAGFLYAGISSLKRSSELQYEIREEKQSRQIAEEWLKEHVTADMLKEFEVEGQAPEITAMKQLEFISGKLKEQFESSEEFLDELAEEYYDELMQG